MQGLLRNSTYGWLLNAWANNETCRFILDLARRIPIIAHPCLSLGGTTIYWWTRDWVYSTLASYPPPSIINDFMRPTSKMPSDEEKPFLNYADACVEEHSTLSQQKQKHQHCLLTFSILANVISVLAFSILGLVILRSSNPSSIRSGAVDGITSKHELPDPYCEKLLLCSRAQMLKRLMVLQLQRTPL